MTGWEWFEAAIRVLAVASLAAGAVRSVRRARQQGAARTAATAVTSVAMLLYIVGGVLWVTWYFVFVAPAHAALFGLGAVLYFGGGLWIIGRTSAYLEARLGASDAPDVRF